MAGHTPVRENMDEDGKNRPRGGNSEVGIIIYPIHSLKWAVDDGTTAKKAISATRSCKNTGLTKQLGNLVTD